MARRKKVGRHRGSKNDRPWYWGARECWCVTRNGKRIALRDRDGNLITDELGAMNRFEEMRQGQEAYEIRDSHLVAFILENYLKHLTTRPVPAAPETVKAYAVHCQSFVDLHPTLIVRNLRRHHVEEWWEVHVKWGHSMKNLTGGLLKSALNWAADQDGGDLIDANPIKTMKLPKMGRRSATAVVTQDEFDRVFNLVESQEVRDLLTVLRETGTRPINLTRATAKNLSPDGKFLIFASHTNQPGQVIHKTANKTDKPLMVPLNDAARAVVQRLKFKHPEAELFRTPTGKVWTRNRWANTIRNYAERAGLAGRFMAYSMRHSLATDMIRRGEKIEMVAAVLGNTPAVATRNYIHLPELHKSILETVNRNSYAASAVKIAAS